MSQKIINSCFYSLIAATLLVILGTAVVRYGDAREEAGRQAVITAYEGGIVRLEAPNKVFATGKGVPNIQLHFGLFSSPVTDGKTLLIDEDEELPIAASTPAATAPPKGP